MEHGIFGEKWDAPVCDDAREVSTPVGTPCQECREPIELGDRGLLEIVVRLEGTTVEPIHRECHLRSVLGSIGHLQGTCSCYGGDSEDPPGMSRRESALAVWDWVERNGVRG